MKKILITPRSFQQSGEESSNLLKQNGFELVFNTTGKTLTEEQMLEQCAEVDGLIVGVDPVTAKVLQNSKRLKAVSKYGAGLDNIDIKVSEELGIRVDKAAGTNATSVAELAVGLFFSLARSISFASISTKTGGWERKKGVELTGKIVGILGMGNIGKEVARMVYGLGMKVIAYDPYLNPEDACISKYSIKMLAIEDVISQADFLTLHLPLTDETKYMINEKTLDRMKPTAYLVNTSRGELINEDALYVALSENVIAGAAEDVFSKEPPEGHKLLCLDNFILTSHIGAFTTEANKKMALRSTLNLIDMLKNT